MPNDLNNVRKLILIHNYYMKQETTKKIHHFLDKINMYLNDMF